MIACDCNYFIDFSLIKFIKFIKFVFVEHLEPSLELQVKNKHPNVYHYLIAVNA